MDVNNRNASIGFLCEAVRVQTERGKQYDQKDTGERSFQRVAIAFNAITGRNLRGSEIALIQQLLKDVRQWTNPHRAHMDSLLDGVSYAALKAEEVLAETQTAAVYDVGSLIGMMKDDETP